MSEKQELRKTVRLLKREYRQEQLATLSLAIIERLIMEPHFRKAKTVMLYCALPDEVDTRELLNHCIEKGKKVLLPKVTGETTMELRQYTGNDDLAVGAFGILEPTGATFNAFDTIEVAVIPGMAFDSNGNRLGRGKGYYDRFLSMLPARIYKIGVCFDFQKFEHIPTATNDIQMDCVI